MIPYEPKIGDIVVVNEFFIKVSELSTNHVAGEVVVNENRDTVFCRVPLQSVEPFDPTKDEAVIDNLERN